MLSFWLEARGRGDYGVLEPPSADEHGNAASAAWVVTRE
jgi:hypothetical protein